MLLNFPGPAQVGVPVPEEVGTCPVVPVPCIGSMRTQFGEADVPAL